MQPLPPEQRELLSTGILQEPFKVYPDVYSTSNRAKSNWQDQFQGGAVHGGGAESVVCISLKIDWSP